jgi:hypothetical protein
VENHTSVEKRNLDRLEEVGKIIRNDEMQLTELVSWTKIRGKGVKTEHDPKFPFRPHFLI